MFSFFGKKKHSPDTPPEETDPIPGATTEIPPATDDYIFIERKSDQPNPTQAGQSTYGEGSYPPATMMYPGLHGIGYPNDPQRNTSSPPLGGVHALQGVPFKLCPELSESDTLGMTQLEIDEILALMTKRLQFEAEYEFILEREIINQ